MESSSHVYDQQQQQKRRQLHLDLADEGPRCLLESSPLQMSSFTASVPDAHVWNQEFPFSSSSRESGSSTERNMNMNMNMKQNLGHNYQLNEPLQLLSCSSSSHVSNNQSPVNYSDGIATKVEQQQKIPFQTNFNDSSSVLDERLQVQGSWCFQNSGLDLHMLQPQPPLTITGGRSCSSGALGSIDYYHHQGQQPQQHAGVYKTSASPTFDPAAAFECKTMPVLDFMESKPSHLTTTTLHNTLPSSSSSSSPSSFASAVTFLQDPKPEFLGTAHSIRTGMITNERPEQGNDNKKMSNHCARVVARDTASPSASASVTSVKKSRIESAGAVPSFKVRKEKLGDRITALQQLVSPFGKTDTASVLLEAIGYIKFLQEQVRTLSTPYMESGLGGGPGTGTTATSSQAVSNSNNRENKESKQPDLRSRGLCLVPVSYTLHVTNDNAADFWSSARGATSLR